MRLSTAQRTIQHFLSKQHMWFRPDSYCTFRDAHSVRKGKRVTLNWRTPAPTTLLARKQELRITESKHKVWLSFTQVASGPKPL